MTTLNPLPVPAAGPSAQPSGSGSSPAAQAGTDTFLQLLVAELRTQNPLDPQKGTEFVSQLAQFNTLEQLIAIRAELQPASPPAGSPPSTSNGAAAGAGGRGAGAA